MKFLPILFLCVVTACGQANRFPVVDGLPLLPADFSNPRLYLTTNAVGGGALFVFHTGSTNGTNRVISLNNLAALLAPSALTVEEDDGTPSVIGVSEIRVTNTKLTDLGGGIVALDLSGGGAGSGDSIDINGSAVVDLTLTNSTKLFWVLDTATTPDTVYGYVSNIVNAEIATGAAIARSKIASGTAGHVVVNDGSSGALSSLAELTLATHTAGNYAATVSGTTSEVEVAGSGSENAAIVVGLPDAVLLAQSLGIGTTLGTAAIPLRIITANNSSQVAINQNTSGGASAYAAFTVANEADSMLFRINGKTNSNDPRWGIIQQVALGSSTGIKYQVNASSSHRFQAAAGTDRFVVDASGVAVTGTLASSGTITQGGTAVSLAGHAHAGTDITSGLVGTARLGSGTADTTSFLRGDQTWQPILGLTDGDKGDIRVSATGTVWIVDDDAVELADDTTGNYVATITGTASEVEVSGSGSENADITVGLPNSVRITTGLALRDGITSTFIPISVVQDQNSGATIQNRNINTGANAIAHFQLGNDNDQFTLGLGGSGYSDHPRWGQITHATTASGVGILYNVNTGNEHRFRVNSTEVASIDGSGISAVGTIGAGGAITSGGIVTGDTLRAIGATVAGTGAGLELAYSGGSGIIQAYDRDASAFDPLLIRGSDITFWAEGVPYWQISTTGHLIPFDSNRDIGSVSDPVRAIYSGTVVVGTTLTVGGTAVSLTGHTHGAGDIVSGTMATARLGSGTANSTTFLRGDSTWQAVTGLTEGDKGDITVSGGTAIWTLDSDTVVFAKMQNITTDRLIGRDTAGTSDPEEISVGGGLEFTGSAGIQRSAISGDVVIAAGAATATIQANSVALSTDTTGNYVSSVETGAGLTGGDPGSEGLAVILLWAPETFVNNVTIWNSANSTRTLTAGLSGATDPVITFGNSSVDVSTGTLSQGGTPVSLSGHAHAASDITSGTMATARLGSGTANSTTFLRGDQTWQIASIPGHAHAASDITSGTMATARLGSGSADSTTFLRGDSTWQVVSVGDDVSVNATSATGAKFIDNAEIEWTINTTPNPDEIEATILGIPSGAIPNDAVTYARMQNVSAASRLIGRGSAGGAGDPEEISLGTGLSMSGTTLSVTSGSFSGAVTFRDARVVTGAPGNAYTVTLAALDTAKQYTVDLWIVGKEDASGANRVSGYTDRALMYHDGAAWQYVPFSNYQDTEFVGGGGSGAGTFTGVSFSGNNFRFTVEPVDDENTRWNIFGILSATD